MKTQTSSLKAAASAASATSASAPAAIHIFKAGRFTAIDGQSYEFSEADVAATAAAYDVALHEAPIVLGHPQLDDPAQGWIKSLSATGKGLFAMPRDCDPAFVEGVKARRYSKVSAKFYAPDAPNNPAPGVWYLRHVGFLGAQPPAVKGLEAPAFAEKDEEGCVSFAEDIAFGDWNDRLLARVMRGLRDFFIGEFGQEKADRALSAWDVEQLQENALQPETPEETKSDAHLSTAAFADFGDPANSNTPPTFTPESTHPTKKETSVSPEEAAKLKADNARLTADLAAKNAATKAAQAAAIHQDNAAFAEGLIGEGKLLPKHKERAIAILNLAATPNAEGASPAFSEGETTQPLLNAVRELLSEAQPQVAFCESATKARAGSLEINPLVANAEARAKP